MIKNFTTIIAWLEFKADQMLWAYGYTHIVDDYSTLDYLYDFYNEVSLVLSMIRETDITSKDESTRKLIIRTIALMRQAIGTSLDIFSGDFKEACDYQSGCGVTIPKLTVHEKQIIDNVTFQLNTISSTAFE
jgi:hypothetical protein